jgi:hypothetical protein
MHTNSVRISHETHYVSATETNGLTLFGERVVAYCENHTETTDTVFTSQETTLRLLYKAQQVNTVWGNNSRSLLLFN